MLERVQIRRDGDIGIAIVTVRARAQALGFSEDRQDRLCTAVSELARNIVKYAGSSGGDLLVLDWPDRQDREQIQGLVIQARDNGPGIPDVTRALREHYSSGGSLGLGLPGVQRLVDEFEIISEPRGSSSTGGTVVTIRMRARC